MLRQLFRYFILFLLLLASRPVAAFLASVDVRSLNDIPAKDVNVILQDSKGFMWFGTLDGLHRFDGYQYKTYRISERGNSISSNLILTMDEDQLGNIWIGTYGKGICKLNPATDTFTRYVENEENPDLSLPYDIQNLLIDSNNVMWVGTWKGIIRVRLDEEMNKIEEVTRFSLDSAGRYDYNSVKSMLCDRQGNIWVGTNHQVIRIENRYASADSVRFQRFDITGEALASYEQGVLAGGTQLYSILPDGNTYRVQWLAEGNAWEIVYADGRIWTGQRQGIKCFEKASDGSWKPTFSLKKDFSEKRLSSNIVTALHVDHVGQIWVGTRNGGVDIINLKPRGFKHYKHTMRRGSLSNNLVMCIFEDSRQNLWMGTEEAGLNVLKPGNSYDAGFKTIQVNDYPNEDRCYALEEVKTKSGKHQRLMWAGTSHFKYLTVIDPETLSEVDPGFNTRIIGHVFALENMGDSVLWVGTYGRGLWRLQLNDQGKVKAFRRFVPDSSKLLSLIIRSIFLDSKGNLWIGTDKGLNYVAAKDVKDLEPDFQAFTTGDAPGELAHDYILQVLEARNGVYWIGTMGGGLVKCMETAPENYYFISITTEDGLPNNTIKSIVEDDNGFLWLASNKGLTRYNPADGSIVNYDKFDGLQDNVFSEICGTKRKNGEIVFGGINGFNVFNPLHLNRNEEKPRLFFTDFRILNQDVAAGEKIDGKVILSKTIENTHEITLDYRHNSFSIGFVGIEYLSPQKNNYRYILEGFDKQWYKASPDYRMANYTNIPDGEYTFKVMASNADNVWTDTPIELKIVVRPPLYRSGWALFVYFILLMLIVWAVVHVVREITQRRRDVLLANIEKQRVEELARVKLQFFTNISHEFRTPLSLMSAPLEQLLQDGEKCYSKNQLYNLKLIKHNVGVMMRLVNQLLDFRKLDQNKLKLTPSRQSLNDMLENIYLSFEVLARQKRIEYEFIPYAGGDEIWVDVEKMEKVIYNLLSNAFKYTDEGGKIVLKADANPETNMFEITVSDTGIGIDAEQAPHIFERYYRIDSKRTKNISGTGIGLALAKGIVDLHQGEIGFYPNEEKGTVFFVKLRMGNAHFPKDILVETQELSEFAAPKYASPVEPGEEELVQDTSPRGEKRKMLIVEDNFDLRKQVKNIFRDEFEVHEAEDGVEGLKKVREVHPDIVVTDVMMPNMDGMELTNAIKTDEEISHIPVLLLTAKNTDETIVEGYEFGADGYVAKPFNLDVLKARVKSLISNREKMRARFQKEIEINPKIISNTPADSKFLDKILALIEANLSNSEYSVEQLAEDYGVSRIYLNRKIKGLTGETTIEFMRNIRLKHAAELLKQNKLNISEVAWEVGYNDLRTFRKRFKDKFELTPSEFARQYKDKQD